MTNIQLTGFERSAISEGISSHISWAGAYRSQAAEMTLGVNAASIDAGIYASVVEARGFVAGTLSVGCTFSGTRAVRIAEVSLK